jgi:L-serine kinase (ADP)
MKITHLSLKKLKPHEKVSPKRLAKLIRQISEQGYIANPIIVEKEHFIILDGHHRVKALLEMGYKKIPTVLVDYNDDDIVVISRRKKIKVSKKIIVEMALKQKMFPYKTSKHAIPLRPKNINIPLKKLRM